MSFDVQKVEESYDNADLQPPISAEAAEKKVKARSNVLRGASDLIPTDGSLSKKQIELLLKNSLSQAVSIDDARLKDTLLETAAEEIFRASSSDNAKPVSVSEVAGLIDKAVKKKTADGFLGELRGMLGIEVSVAAGTNDAAGGADALRAALEPRIEALVTAARTRARKSGQSFDESAFRSKIDKAIVSYGSAIDKVRAGMPMTIKEAKALVGPLEDVVGRSGLQTVDGVSIDGLAYDGGIVLDTSLEGSPEQLVNALTEELGERFFQTTFGGTSEGDFGAEVSGRVSGLVTGDASFLRSGSASGDTVIVDLDGEIVTAEAVEEVEAAVSATIDFQGSDNIIVEYRNSEGEWVQIADKSQLGDKNQKGVPVTIPKGIAPGNIRITNLTEPGGAVFYGNGTNAKVSYVGGGTQISFGDRVLDKGKQTFSNVIINTPTPPPDMVTKPGRTNYLASFDGALTGTADGALNKDELQAAGFTETDAKMFVKLYGTGEGDDSRILIPNLVRSESTFLFGRMVGDSMKKTGSSTFTLAVNDKGVVEVRNVDLSKASPEALANALINSVATARTRSNPLPDGFSMAQNISGVTKAGMSAEELQGALVDVFGPRAAIAPSDAAKVVQSYGRDLGSERRLDVVGLIAFFEDEGPLSYDGNTGHISFDRSVAPAVFTEKKREERRGMVSGARTSQQILKETIDAVVSNDTATAKTDAKFDELGEDIEDLGIVETPEEMQELLNLGTARALTPVTAPTLTAGNEILLVDDNGAVTDPGATVSPTRTDAAEGTVPVLGQSILVKDPVTRADTEAYYDKFFPPETPESQTLIPGMSRAESIDMLHDSATQLQIASVDDNDVASTGRTLAGGGQLNKTEALQVAASTLGIAARVTVGFTRIGLTGAILGAQFTNLALPALQVVVGDAAAAAAPRRNPKVSLAVVTIGTFAAGSIAASLYARYKGGATTGNVTETVFAGLTSITALGGLANLWIANDKTLTPAQRTRATALAGGFFAAGDALGGLAILASSTTQNNPASTAFSVASGGALVVSGIAGGVALATTLVTSSEYPTFNPGPGNVARLRGTGLLALGSSSASAIALGVSAATTANTPNPPPPPTPVERIAAEIVEGPPEDEDGTEGEGETLSDEQREEILEGTGLA